MTRTSPSPPDGYGPQAALCGQVGSAPTTSRMSTTKRMRPAILPPYMERETTRRSVKGSISRRRAVGVDAPSHRPEMDDREIDAAAENECEEYGPDLP